MRCKPSAISQSLARHRALLPLLALSALIVSRCLPRAIKGYRDDDDGVLVTLEARAEAKMLQRTQAEWDLKLQTQQEGDADVDQWEDDEEARHRCIKKKALSSCCCALGVSLP